MSRESPAGLRQEDGLKIHAGRPANSVDALHNRQPSNESNESSWKIPRTQSISHGFLSKSDSAPLEPQSPELKKKIQQAARHVVSQADPGSAEQRMMGRNGAHTFFHFMQPMDKYHAYYQRQKQLLQPAPAATQDTSGTEPATRGNIAHSVSEQQDTGTVLTRYDLSRHDATRTELERSENATLASQPVPLEPESTELRKKVRQVARHVVSQSDPLTAEQKMMGSKGAETFFHFMQPTDKYYAYYQQQKQLVHMEMESAKHEHAFHAQSIPESTRANVEKHDDADTEMNVAAYDDPDTASLSEEARVSAIASSRVNFAPSTMFEPTSVGGRGRSFRQSSQTKPFVPAGSAERAPHILRYGYSEAFFNGRVDDPLDAPPPQTGTADIDPTWCDGLVDEHLERGREKRANAVSLAEEASYHTSCFGRLENCLRECAWAIFTDDGAVRKQIHSLRCCEKVCDGDEIRIDSVKSFHIIAVEEEASSPSGHVFRICVSKMTQLRNHPANDAEFIGISVHRGDWVQMVDEEAEWLKVTSIDGTGWMRKEFLELQAPQAASPAAWSNAETVASVVTDSTAVGAFTAPQAGFTPVAWEAPIGPEQYTPTYVVPSAVPTAKPKTNSTPTARVPSVGSEKYTPTSSPEAALQTAIKRDVVPNAVPKAKPKTNAMPTAREVSTWSEKSTPASSPEMALRTATTDVVPNAAPKAKPNAKSTPTARETSDASAFPFTPSSSSGAVLGTTTITGAVPNAAPKAKPNAKSTPTAREASDASAFPFTPSSTPGAVLGTTTTTGAVPNAAPKAKPNAKSTPTAREASVAAAFPFTPSSTSGAVLGTTTITGAVPNAAPKAKPNAKSTPMARDASVASETFTPSSTPGAVLGTTTITGSLPKAAPKAKPKTNSMPTAREASVGSQKSTPSSSPRAKPKGKPKAKTNAPASPKGKRQ